MSEAIVLGAGMVGVSAALSLRDRGWNVTLIDRKPPGQETSFGNAGIIQSESVEPYAMPRGIRDLFDIATFRSNDVYYAFRELPLHVSSLLRYWWYSESGRHREIARHYATLIARAAGTHEPIIRRAGADNLIQRSGYRTLYRDGAKFDEALARAKDIEREFGTRFRALDPAETRKEEPALKSAGLGTIHWLEPWTAADPGALVTAYAELFEREGGRFLIGDAESLKAFPSGKGWSVRTRAGTVEAEHVVVALGVWSRGLLERFGARFPMVLKRGYHAHYSSPVALNMTLMDSDRGYVMAPMRAGTRITTGAHLARPGQAPVYRQLERAEASANELLSLGNRVEQEPWSGTRPCMPDMLPVIGPVGGQKGLWANFGHGHQGFTLGPASAELLTAMILGEKPPVDPAPFRPGR